jgi:hypothetical protein
LALVLRSSLGNDGWLGIGLVEAPADRGSVKSTYS